MSYVIQGKCRCQCSIHEHVQVVVLEKGRNTIVPAECKNCRSCEAFKAATCCGHCMVCNWGGDGPPPSPVNNDTLRQQATYLGGKGGTLGQQGFAEEARDELVRRGMPDPWKYGPSSRPKRQY